MGTPGARRRRERGGDATEEGAEGAKERDAPRPTPKERRREGRQREEREKRRKTRRRAEPSDPEPPPNHPRIGLGCQPRIDCRSTRICHKSISDRPEIDLRWIPETDSISIRSRARMGPTSTHDWPRIWRSSSSPILRRRFRSSVVYRRLTSSASVVQKPPSSINVDGVVRRRPSSSRCVVDAGSPPAPRPSACVSRGERGAQRATTGPKAGSRRRVTRGRRLTTKDDDGRRTIRRR